MGARGPKPVDTDVLKRTFESWARYLIALREGRPGKIEKISSDPPSWKTFRENVTRSQWAVFKREHPGAMARGGFKWVPHRKVKVPIRGGKRCKWETTGEIKIAIFSQKIIVAYMIPVDWRERRLPLGLTESSSGKFSWLFTLPINRRPAIWQQLKNAHSIGQMRRALRRMRAWAKPHPELRHLYPHARDLLKVRRLHNYPKNERASSDNKRIELFAKALAGLEFGLAPATARHRLRGYRFLREPAEHLDLWPIAKSAQQEKSK